MLTERTEVSFRLSKFADKKERWQKIAREACKQSGNPWVPKFDDPILIGDVLSQMDNGDDCWIASLQHRTANLLPKQGSKCITLFIGPEGGWSIEEENMARELNLSFFSLGPHVLRLETAAISALAVARQHLLC